MAECEKEAKTQKKKIWSLESYKCLVEKRDLIHHSFHQRDQCTYRIGRNSVFKTETKLFGV